MVTVYVGLLVLFFLIVVAPVLYLLWGSFWSTGPFTPGGHFTLENYIETYLNPITYILFVNTFIIAIGTTLLSSVLGIAMAWLVARTNTPFRSLVIPIMILPQLVPSYLIATAYIFILGPQIGWLNIVLDSLLGIRLSIYSFWGIILIKGISYSPLAFLITLPAFRNFDPALEEASRLSGAGTLSTFKAITFPVMLPAVTAAVLLIFTKSLDEFSIVAFLGLPADPAIQVFSTRLWQAFSNQVPPDYGLGTALSTTLLLLGMGALLIQSYATRNQTKYTTITGRGYTAQRYDLGKWRWGAFSIAVLVLLISIVLPFSILFIASVTSTWYGKMFFLTDAVSFTLAHYESLLRLPDFTRAVFNSLLIATVGAFLGMMLSSLTSYFVIKVDDDDGPRLISSTSDLMDQLTYLPAAIPGIVMATGFLWFALTIPYFGLYGSLWLIMLAYIARKLPEGTRTTHSAMAQVSDILEDQARVSGASWLENVKDIILPLINRSFVAGYLILFVDMMKNLTVPLLLYDVDSLVLPVLIFNLKLEGQYELLAAVGMFLLVIMMIVLGIAQYVFDVSFVHDSD